MQKKKIVILEFFFFCSLSLFFFRLVFRRRRGHRTTNNLAVSPSTTSILSFPLFDRASDTEEPSRALSEGTKSETEKTRAISTSIESKKKNDGQS